LASAYDESTSGATDETGTVTTDPAVTEAPLEAPQNWAAKDKEFFTKHPREIQQWVLDRHKAMEGDYTKKTMELAPFRKEREQLDEIFSPYDERIQLAGSTRVDEIKRLVAASAYLERDPKAGIQWLANAYSVDLSNLAQGTTQSQPDPALKQVTEQVTNLQRAMKAQQDAYQQHQMQVHLTKVTTFAQEKDAQGNLKHPFFEDVSDDIVKSLKAGLANDLQDAYDRAIYANPDTRAKVIAAEDAKRKTQLETERKKKAEAAKKAGFDVRGQGAAASTAAERNSLRADLESAFESTGRV
jgi:hypothetical protein